MTGTGHSAGESLGSTIGLARLHRRSCRLLLACGISRQAAAGSNEGPNARYRLFDEAGCLRPRQRIGERKETSTGLPRTARRMTVRTGLLAWATPSHRSGADRRERDLGRAATDGGIPGEHPREVGGLAEALRRSTQRIALRTEADYNEYLRGNFFGQTSGGDSSPGGG